MLLPSADDQCQFELDTMLAGAAPTGARPLMGVSRILGGPDDVIREQESGVGFDIAWYGGL